MPVPPFSQRVFRVLARQNLFMVRVALDSQAAFISVKNFLGLIFRSFHFSFYFYVVLPQQQDFSGNTPTSEFVFSAGADYAFIA